MFKSIIRNGCKIYGAPFLSSFPLCASTAIEIALSSNPPAFFFIVG